MDDFSGMRGELDEMAVRGKQREDRIQAPGEDHWRDVNTIGTNVTRKGAISSSLMNKRVAAVMYIDVGRGSGTGFLTKIGGTYCICTNNHVIDSIARAKAATCYFDFEKGRKGSRSVKLDPSKFFHTEESPFDFTLVAFQDARQVAKRSIIPFEAKSGMREGMGVLIIQHPGGAAKTYSEGEIMSADDFDGEQRGDMSYDADTLPGSSGSPVFDSKLNLIGIHHSRDPRVKENRGTSVTLMISKLPRRGFF